ncbi:MAG TPA: hypothetical protein VGO93_25210 [Candidatus Xenobia bacterium]
MKRWPLVGLVALTAAAQAYPPMPPPPRPVDAVKKVALAFAADADQARRVAASIGQPYLQRTSQIPLAESILPPELVPINYHPEARTTLSYRYELRRTVERNKWEVVMQRTGVDYITMECRHGMPILDTASNIEQGMAFLMIPSIGPEAHQLHVLALNRRGDMGTAQVRFSDGESTYDVLVPAGKEAVRIQAVEPEDKSF